MATKLAETTTKARSRTSLDHLGSNCPDADYSDVADNYGYWSSSQLSSDGCIHGWSKDVLSCKLSMIPTIKHNTSACSETSSVECIDVALESHKEVNRSAKTVPKRQIQLKRRDTVEHPSSENNNALHHVPGPSRPRDLLHRQHSTPAALHQDCRELEQHSVQAERKQRLQKSLSLDETSGKTKMASCIIKSVLSKRMQHEQNLQDVSDRAFAPSIAYSKASNDYLTSAKEVCNEVTGPLSDCFTFSSSPTLKPKSKTKSSSIKEHISVSSKTQAKLIAKHSFNPPFSGLSRTEFLGRGTEITITSESEKEKLGLSKEAVWLSSQSSGEKLSCDSAKGKACNPSVAKQATVKTTPEECRTAQGAHKQQNVKNQPLINLEKEKKQNEVKESTPSPTMAACLGHGLDANTSDNALSQFAQCGAVKAQQSDRGELRTPGLSVNMGAQSQGKFKAIAPVHMVRDMRSLVKNKYSLSFRGPAEAGQGLEDKAHDLSSKMLHQINNQGGDKGKRYNQDEKLHVQKFTSPLALDRIRDLAPLLATPKGCATKATAFLESHDNIPSAGFTKVSPISTVKPNSCALSKSPEAQNSQIATSQADVQCSNTNVKQTNWTDIALRASEETSTAISKNGQSVDSSKPGYEKRRGSGEPQSQELAAVQQYCPPSVSSEQQNNSKSSDQICSANKDGHQTPGPPPGSQTSAGPLSTCILTVAPTPVLPPYFYKPNSLGYQTISPHMGTVSYVQGPLLLQTPSHKQPTNSPVPLMRSLSEEGRLLSLPCQTDGCTVQASSIQSENEETRPKKPSLDTQQCTAFTALLGAKVTRGNASFLYPEVGEGLAQSSHQLLLDPETGHCFYVDKPQLPQRKMLFDPETCQYIEVLLPRQTLSSPALPHPCPVPFTPLHIPAIYTPPCLSYVQAHHAVLQPPGP
ncbi:hypothetical protein P4O66_002886 [Electrophorus voltai]|uniref:DUF4585 domain-containing protein n=1 Tax=Electrophorus voltai TaxID=2609070 RepID=A0AAD8YVQ7_9TELE|nr:hypothetical protein P4O66_002886 [Electrophorus voltai]